MRILVTGAGGYLGSALARRLADEGHGVTGLENDHRGLEVVRDLRGVEAVEGDVTCEEDVAAAARGASAVFHMAGVSSVDACRDNPRLALEVNGYAVRTLLEHSMDDVQLFAYPSSVAGMYTIPRGAVYKHRSGGGDAVYTRPSGGAVTEEDPVVPVNDYGVSKFLGETYARAYRELHGAPTLVFRQSNVYGPSPAGPGDGVARIFVERALRGEPLEVHGPGEQTRDFLFVDDLLDAYVAALEGQPSGETLNLSSGASTSVNRLAEKVSGLVGEAGVNHVGSREEELEIKKYTVSNERARGVLGWEPKTSLDDGLKRLIDAMEDG